MSNADGTKERVNLRGLRIRRRQIGKDRFETELRFVTEDTDQTEARRERHMEMAEKRSKTQRLLLDVYDAMRKSVDGDSAIANDSPTLDEVRDVACRFIADVDKTTIENECITDADYQQYERYCTGMIMARSTLDLMQQKIEIYEHKNQVMRVELYGQQAITTTAAAEATTGASVGGEMYGTTECHDALCVTERSLRRIGALLTAVRTTATDQQRPLPDKLAPFAVEVMAVAGRTHVLRRLIEQRWEGPPPNQYPQKLVAQVFHDPIVRRLSVDLQTLKKRKEKKQENTTITTTIITTK